MTRSCDFLYLDTATAERLLYDAVASASYSNLRQSMVEQQQHSDGRGECVGGNVWGGMCGGECGGGGSNLIQLCRMEGLWICGARTFHDMRAEGI